MSSAAQIEANRRNSRLSTGPRTDEGKAAARRNALRHGLAARTLVVTPGEDPAEFRAFAADLRQDLAPEGAVEEALAQRLAILAWRLERAARIEAALMTDEAALIASAAGTAPGLVFPEEMAALARYEAGIDRAFERTMKLFRERQTLRRAGALPDSAGELTERSQFGEDEAAPALAPEPPPLAAAPDASTERSQFADEASAERSQFDDAGDDSAERSQFDDEDDLLAPQNFLAPLAMTAPVPA